MPSAKVRLDYIAVSFVRNAADIRLTRKILEEVRGSAGIIAKIERSEAIALLERRGVLKTGDMAIITKGD